MNHKQLPEYEQTLVLIKPDAVQRGLIGDIIHRFERKGLKIVAMKMEWATGEKAGEHYKWPEADMIALGERSIVSYKEKGVHLDETPMDVAKRVHKMLVKYLTAGPMVAMIVEGAHAVAYVRKLRGATNPLNADVGTIAGDLTIDSYNMADATDRAIRTIVHASGSVEEAKREIALWFKPSEIFDYDLAIEQILYSADWGAH